MFLTGGAPGHKLRCKVCGEPINAGRALHGGGHCGSLACMTQLTIQSRAEKDAARDKAWNGIGAEVAALSGVSLTAVVPYQDDPLVPLPEDRVAAFEANLRASIEVAFSDEPPAPDVDPDNEDAAPPTAVGIAGCTACQGSCCKQGAATHGFIGPRMMVRQTLRHPEKSAEDMLSYYMDQLPEVATEGGCLYQGAQGCVLDRGDRAQICNAFKCWSLKKSLELELENPGAEIAIAASPAGEGIGNWLIVTADDAPLEVAADDADAVDAGATEA